MCNPAHLDFFLEKNQGGQWFLLPNMFYQKINNTMKKYVCDVCGWEYDPAVGVPEAGIPAGTAFEDLPEDFECPLCSVGKDQFSEAE